MKNIISPFVIVFILFILYVGANIYFQINYNNDIKQITIDKDSVILNYKHNTDSLNYKIDSLIAKQDSLNSEIFILKYKLARIKEYNKIAENGNNIKFLRGWINRVLNE